MKHLERSALVIELIKELRDNSSWCGETHLQKAAYFLESLAEVPTDFGFILYKHGPYSFNLHDELSALQANRLVILEPSPPYGPRLKPTDNGEKLTTKQQTAIQHWRAKIKIIAQKLGEKNVAQLERLGTALLVTNEGTHSAEKRAQILHELKPHVPYEDALDAVRELDKISPDITTAH